MNDFLIVFSLTCMMTASAWGQNLVKVTDPANPIVSDPGVGNGSYAGASWIDYDGDGLYDLFINRISTIYRNLGSGNFDRVLNAISDQGNSYGNTWGDYDNDGDIDCYTAGGSVRGSYLYRNDGNGMFAKITTGAIGDSITNSGWGCAWGDYNDDTYLDLVVAAPFGFAGIFHENRFFHNNGDGTFSRVDTSVIEDGTAPYTVPTWYDYDLDGDSDLFIGSGPATGQLAPDFLYRNLKQETGFASFERIDTDPIATDLVDGQVWNWIDYDNDGDLDGFLTNYNGGVPNNLYRNNGGTYEKMTEQQVGTIVSDLGLSLANLWGDFDNDGDLDCIVTNDGNSTVFFYTNNGNGTFARIDTMGITAGIGVHYGTAAADYDMDGDLDVYVAGTTATKGLYRNDLSGDNHWIIIKCRGIAGSSGSNFSGIGAVVRVKATIAGIPVWQMREVSAQNSFNSQSMLDAHFGLGDASIVDSVVISWPGGMVDALVGVDADDHYTATEGQGIVVDVQPVSNGVPVQFVLEQNYPNPFNPGTRIVYHVNTSTSVVLGVYDLLGREVATLASGKHAPGRYTVSWDASAYPSGTYFYRLRSGTVVLTKRMLLLR